MKKFRRRLQRIQNKTDAVVQRRAWNLGKFVAVVRISFDQMVVNQLGLLKVFVAMLVRFVDVFPRRHDENAVVSVLAAGFVKKSGVAVADVVHVRQNIGNAAVDENVTVRFGFGGVELFFSAFE